MRSSGSISPPSVKAHGARRRALAHDEMLNLTANAIPVPTTVEAESQHFGTNTMPPVCWAGGECHACYAAAFNEPDESGDAAGVNEGSATLKVNDAAVPAEQVNWVLE